MSKKTIHILGGGPAGLALACMAREKGIDFRLYESGAQTGGICQTRWIEFQKMKFGYDTGAHRLHDKIPEVTSWISELLDGELLKVDAPSAIVYKNKFIDFPLSPQNMVRKLGNQEILKGVIDYLKRPRKLPPDNLGAMATRNYGKHIAEIFLLNYSEKLWGTDPYQLASEVSGSRLKGLDLKAFFSEMLYGKKRKTRHLDGEFRYPEKGYGMIVEAMYKSLDPKKVELHSPVRELHTENQRISRILLDGSAAKTIEVGPEDQVISTLPISVLVKGLRPVLPLSTIHAVSMLRYRDVLLGIILLRKAQVTSYASLYFPDKRYAFTRIYEPSNRGPALAPDGYTLIVAEIPGEEGRFNLKDFDLQAKVIKPLIDLGLFDASEVVHTAVDLLPKAYPVIDLASKETLDLVNDQLKVYSNLHLAGRNGRFKYVHLHNLVHEAKELIQMLNSLN